MVHMAVEIKALFIVSVKWKEVKVIDCLWFEKKVKCYLGMSKQTWQHAGILMEIIGTYMMFSVINLY